MEQKYVTKSLNQVQNKSGFETNIQGDKQSFDSACNYSEEQNTLYRSTMLLKSLLKKPYNI